KVSRARPSDRKVALASTETSTRKRLATHTATMAPTLALALVLTIRTPPHSPTRHSSLVWAESRASSRPPRPAVRMRAPRAFLLLAVRQSLVAPPTTTRRSSTAGTQA
ncbi:hypothetical protein LPJ71_010711, partial [Coemansia sp. S17]